MGAAPPSAVAAAGEEILLSCGLAEEAYRRYALEANWRTTYLATFRAIAKKYPEMSKEAILSDLATRTPGEEGKWFAAARSAGLHDLALDLVRSSPADPRTLTRAARAELPTRPAFARAAALAAVRWAAAGYGYDLEGRDVAESLHLALEAARRLGSERETVAELRTIAAQAPPGGMVSSILARLIPP